MAKTDISHIPLKHELWALIKRLGTIYEEDEEFTKEYAIDIYNDAIGFKIPLKECINCFQILVKQAKLIKPVSLPT